MKYMPVLVSGAAAVLALASPASVFSQVVFEAADFRVNTYTTGEQLRPDIARHGDGAFVLAWQSGGDRDGDGDAVVAQRFGSDGAALGSEFQVNSFTTDSQAVPSLTTLEGGGFVIAWESTGQISGARTEVYAQRFTAAGDPSGGEFQLNTYTTGFQRNVSLAALGDGFVAVWDGDSAQDGDGAGVFARIFDATGTAIGDEFQVNAYTTNDQFGAVEGGPVVAVLPGDDFVVVWQSEFQVSGDIGEGKDVFARIFDSTGIASSGDILVNTVTDNSQADPNVSSNASGDFVVAWQDNRAGRVIYQRVFGANGVAKTDDFLIPIASPTDPFHPQPYLEASGSFAVVWEDRDENLTGTYMRRFDDEGLPITGNVLMNTVEDDRQERPVVISTDGANPTITVAWRDSALDGDGSGVYARRVSGQSPCGDATFDGIVTATDALAALRTAVGTLSCSLCVCDADGSGVITATDALIILQTGVGLDTDPNCKIC